MGNCCSSRQVDLFDSDLSSIVRREAERGLPAAYVPGVPTFVQDCVSYILECSPPQETGDSSVEHLIGRAISAMPRIGTPLRPILVMLKEEQASVVQTFGLLARFFQSLKRPAFPTKYNDELLGIERITESERCRAVADLLHRIRLSHGDEHSTLRFLLARWSDLQRASSNHCERLALYFFRDMRYPLPQSHVLLLLAIVEKKPEEVAASRSLPPPVQSQNRAPLLENPSKNQEKLKNVEEPSKTAQPPVCEAMETKIENCEQPSKKDSSSTPEKPDVAQPIETETSGQTGYQTDISLRPTSEVISEVVNPHCADVATQMEAQTTKGVEGAPTIDRGAYQKLVESKCAFRNVHNAEQGPSQENDFYGVMLQTLHEDMKSVRCELMHFVQETASSVQELHCKVGEKSPLKVLHLDETREAIKHLANSQLALEKEVMHCKELSQEFRATLGNHKEEVNRVCGDLFEARSASQELILRWAAIEKSILSHSNTIRELERTTFQIRQQHEKERERQHLMDSRLQVLEKRLDRHFDVVRDV